MGTFLIGFFLCSLTTSVGLLYYWRILSIFKKRLGIVPSSKKKFKLQWILLPIVLPFSFIFCIPAYYFVNYKFLGRDKIQKYKKDLIETGNFEDLYYKDDS